MNERNDHSVIVVRADEVAQEEEVVIRDGCVPVVLARLAFKLKMLEKSVSWLPS
jgi:hypothetical protein